MFWLATLLVISVIVTLYMRRKWKQADDSQKNKEIKRRLKELSQRIAESVLDVIARIIYVVLLSPYLMIPFLPLIMEVDKGLGIEMGDIYPFSNLWITWVNNWKWVGWWSVLLLILFIMLIICIEEEVRQKEKKDRQILLPCLIFAALLWYYPLILKILISIILLLL